MEDKFSPFRKPLKPLHQGRLIKANKAAKEEMERQQVCLEDFDLNKIVESALEAFGIRRIQANNSNMKRKIKRMQRGNGNIA